MAVKAVPFIMNDERVNAYGFRILTAGIDTSDFEKNPVGFWNHRNEDEYKETPLLPLFIWQNLRKDGTLLKGDCVPDEQDDDAMAVYGKMERGFVNACSVTIDIIETSEDPALMLPGQMRPTVTKCKLVECSPCGLPANASALKLRNAAGQIISLNANNAEEVLTAFQLSNNKTQKQMSTENKTLLIALSALLGLNNDATEQQITNAVSQLKSDKEAANKKYEELNKSISDSMINEAIADEIIDETERETYEQLCRINLSAAKSALDKLRKLSAGKGNGNAGKGGGKHETPETISESLRKLNAGKGGNNAGSPANGECEYDMLRKTNPMELSRIEREEPQRFEQIKQEKLSRISDRVKMGAAK